MGDRPLGYFVTNTRVHELPAQAYTLRFIPALPDGPEFLIIPGWLTRELRNQLKIAIRAASKSWAVLTLAIWAEHFDVEFTTSRNATNRV